MTISTSRVAYVLAAALTLGASANAEEFVTPEGATTYTLASLSEIPESGVTALGDGVFQMANDVTITAGNKFDISGTAALLLGDRVTFEIDCEYNFASKTRVLISSIELDENPAGVKICYDGEPQGQLLFKNIDFEYAALRNLGTVGFDVDSCTFRNANGVLSSAGALAIGTENTDFKITNCIFEDNTVPAIGGAANYFCGLYIANCEFINNNTANTNKPQLNLTVGRDKEVVIKDCTLRGAGLNMVGGIAIGNLMIADGENNVTIEGCTITDHRYGITGVGPMNLFIRDNVLVDNNHEENAMNGGSGISLAGYGYGLNAIISGNYIENSLWGVTIIQCGDVNLGQVDNPLSPGNNVFVNNGNNGVAYDLYNNQVNTVYAQNNTWSVPEQTAELIETVIYHAADNSTLGEVIFMPAKDPNGCIDAVSGKGIEIADGVIVSDEKVDIYDAAGFLIVKGASNPSVAKLPAGVYVAKSGASVLKFQK